MEKNEMKGGKEMKRLIVLMTVMAFMIIATSAFAQQTTSNLDVSASVNANCSITGVTNIIFATPYDSTDPSPNDDGSGNFTFRCTKGTAYDIYITGARQMTSGPEILNFLLFQEAARTTSWPDVSPGVTGTSANNSPITLDVYGRITELQDVATGAYAGTVVITIDF